MVRLIEVVLHDGAFCKITPKALNLFLDRNLIARFKRSDGWVIVGVDPLRGVINKNKYDGHDRRNSSYACIRVSNYEAKDIEYISSKIAPVDAATALT